MIVFEIFLSIFAAVVFILLFIFLCNKVRNGGSYTGMVGKAGELKVNFYLKRLLLEDEKIVSDLLVPIGENMTSQIDSVLITHKGIFVIEIKNVRGYLYGNGYSQYWTQSKYTYYGLKRRKLYNPVLQNMNHCRAIDRLLNSRFKSKNVVILAKYEGGNIEAKNVFTYKSFKEFYSDYDPNYSLSSQQINAIYSKLSAYVCDKEQLKSHIEKVKNKHPEDY